MIFQKKNKGLTTKVRTNPFSWVIHVIPFHLAGDNRLDGAKWGCRAADCCRLGSPGGHRLKLTEPALRKGYAARVLERKDGKRHEKNQNWAEERISRTLGISAL